MPYDIFKKILLEYTERGVSKVKLVKSILKNGFDIENSASHPNC